MKLDITTDVAQALVSVRDIDRQSRFATMRTLNDLGFQGRKDLQGEARRVFDRPTPYVLNSFHVDTATKDRLEVTIQPKYFGGKGVDPQNVLQAEVFGGARKAKRFEVALRRIGVLPAGFMAVPGRGAPLDAYGNLRGSFIVTLLSYFQAFGEQGYSANATAGSIAKRARRGVTKRGFKRIGGVEYFVSRGPGTWFGNGSWKKGQVQHLAAGIWSRAGVHGGNVKPILMFVRAPRYGIRLSPLDVIEKTVTKGYEPLFAFHLQQALRTAR